MPAKQLPGSMSAKKLRAVRSSRFSVRFMKWMISRTSQWSACVEQRVVDGEHARRIALGLEDDRADLRLVDAQPQQRVVELAKCAQRPELIAGREDLRRASVGCAASGARDGQRRRRASRDRCASDTAEYSTASSVTVGVERTERDARAAAPADRTSAASSARALRDALLELAGRIHRVDEPPLDRALALHAFGERAEHVREVAPDLPLVDDARQAAGAGQHAEQRRLRQAHRRVPVVDEHDLVARERQLVAAAGADAVERGEELDARSARSRLPSPAASRW